ncbi:hypothetical protein [Frigoribacterium salinisoli]
MSDVHSDVPPVVRRRSFRGARLGLLVLVAVPFAAVAGWEWQFLAVLLTGSGSGRIAPGSLVPGLLLVALATGAAVTATVLALTDRCSPTPVLRVVVATVAGASTLLLVPILVLEVSSLIDLATTPGPTSRY